MPITTVATLIIAPVAFTKCAVKMFRKTAEIDSILSVRFSDVVNNPCAMIPRWKVKNAKKIYPKSRVSVNYLFKYILHDRKDICDSMRGILDSHRMICQVEIPSYENKRYHNIDIGFTSNGKIEKGESFIDCSIRETLEEARIKIPKKYYDRDFQKGKRAAIGAANLPLDFFVNESAIVYVILV